MIHLRKSERSEPLGPASFWAPPQTESSSSLVNSGIFCMVVSFHWVRSTPRQGETPQSQSRSLASMRGTLNQKIELTQYAMPPRRPPLRAPAPAPAGPPAAPPKPPAAAPPATAPTNPFQLKSPPATESSSSMESSWVTVSLFVIAFLLAVLMAQDLPATCMEHASAIRS